MDEVDEFFDLGPDSEDQKEEENEETVNDIKADKINALVQQLIDKAVEDVHEEVEEIRTLSAYMAGKVAFNATRSVYKNFRKSRRNVYKAYLKTLKEMPVENNFDFILLYRCMKQCEDYYKIECKNIGKALDDCINYALSGHLMDFLLG